MTLISSLLNIYNSSVPFLQTDLNTFEKRLDLKGDSTCFIEEMDGIPVGFTVVNQNGILALCVLPQYRNKGIGTKLLHKAENQIKNKVISILYWVCLIKHIYVRVFLIITTIILVIF